MLAQVFDEFYVLNGWDFDQRELPKNVALIRKINALRLIIRSRVTFISNKFFSDILLIVLLRIFGAKILVVIHGQASRGSSPARSLLKVYLYHFIILLLLIPKKNVICIQNRVKDSFRFKEAHVIEPYSAIKSPVKAYQLDKSILRCIVVANNLSRDHFDKDFLLKVHYQVGAVTILGRDNTSLKNRYPFEFLEAVNEYEYFELLQKADIAVNCLKNPEAPYNLGVLDCISISLPLISVYRPDLIFDCKAAFIPELSGFDDVCKGIKDISIVEQKIMTSHNILKTNFGFTSFKHKWETAVD